MATPTATTFSYIDYIVFALSLVLSAAIGVYHGCIGSKQTTTDEFLMGGKNMGVIPVALSMCASFLSGIQVLGQPAEMYYYGTQYCFFTFCIILAYPITASVFVPIFHGLQVTSAYEYLELRFNKTVRTLGAMTFILQMGGMKAVIWTDAFQMVVILVGLLAVIVKGTMDVGGMDEVFRISDEGGRLIFFNMDPDPTTRTTFWSMIIGGAFVCLSAYATNQATVQRYMSIKNTKRANYALWLNAPLWTLFTILFMLMGLTAYAKYHDCDPVLAQHIDRPDQLVPYFVLDTLGFLRGLPGLFVASCFSAALSTVSSGVNSLSAVVLEDMAKPFYTRWHGRQLDVHLATTWSKYIALFFGVLNVILALLVQLIGAGMIEIALSFFGMVGGPLLGVFAMGMLCPVVNSAGAQDPDAFLHYIHNLDWLRSLRPYTRDPYASRRNSLIKLPKLDMNPMTTIITETPDDNYLYRISYMWYTMISVIVCTLVGVAVSCATGRNKKPAIARLFWPPVLRYSCFLPPIIAVEEKKTNMTGITYRANELPEKEPLNNTPV
ncbi:PREDICTED: sodium-coupled monocarboxylate transporter 1-like [Priapulus caudatus]|uniref:Sodium-coupled monocarboxylate transporter 1-like n=1 Tax=Priapulus caudatus TaxID=37621 RepID=A0ABM1EG49_PRICU|nr:PREDICTED: sodium-coupled monocarboxylate transporter 1-like [Priapulus caudatus]